MKEIELPLNDKTRDKLLSEGVQRLVADDRDHPSARFYELDDIKQQRAYEAAQQKQEIRIPNESAMQLILFSA